MSSYSFLSSNSSENDHPDDMSFEIMDFLSFGEHPREETSARDQHPFCEQSHFVLQKNSSEVNRTSGVDCSKSPSARASSSKGGRMKVAFKTKSELEVLDDGYKWRKYGKKMVKNSPNPRNYYRCSSDGCNVKKRVQREKEDSRYVITTYEGVHNHHALLPASADYEASGKNALANCFQESHVGRELGECFPAPKPERCRGQAYECN